MEGEQLQLVVPGLTSWSVYAIVLVNYFCQLVKGGTVNRQVSIGAAVSLLKKSSTFRNFPFGNVVGTVIGQVLAQSLPASF